MNYPYWIVPFLGGTWVIGIIAIVHVYVSHFAVGGGAFLALTEQIAFKRNDERIYDYVKAQSRFFVLLTTVFGAVTGVGIWWAISLVNPDATATLIQNFSFAWALEYLFFVAELVTAFAYYYTWDKISKEQHLFLARLYFWFSLFTLLIINGILSFMLTPGQWLESQYWLWGVLNPTYLPSTILRVLVMFGIAGLYALLTSSRLKDPDFRAEMVRFAARWLAPVFVLGPAALIWFCYSIPHSELGHLNTLFAMTGPGNFRIVAPVFYACLILSGILAIATLVGPYLNPRRITFAPALLLFLIGLAATGTGEMTRELLRKPYAIGDYMYSNGIRPGDIDRINEGGFLRTGVWAHAAGTNSKLERGELMFRYQCMSCHTVDGYRSIKKLLAGRNQDSILSFLQLLKETDRSKNTYYSGFMPPVAGSTDELRALSDYLGSLVLSPATAAATAGGKGEKPETLSGLAAGTKVYEASACKSCHPEGGNIINPQKPIKGEAFTAKYADDEALAKVIKDGVPGTTMMAHRDMSKDDMKNLVIYIRSLTPSGK